MGKQLAARSEGLDDGVVRGKGGAWSALRTFEKEDEHAGVVSCGLAVRAGGPGVTAPGRCPLPPLRRHAVRAH